MFGILGQKRTSILDEMGNLKNFLPASTAFAIVSSGIPWFLTTRRGLNLYAQESGLVGERTCYKRSRLQHRDVRVRKNKKNPDEFV